VQVELYLTEPAVQAAAGDRVMSILAGAAEQVDTQGLVEMDRPELMTMLGILVTMVRVVVAPGAQAVILRREPRAPAAALVFWGKVLAATAVILLFPMELFYSQPVEAVAVTH
jgi:hypothetical protein